MGPGLHCLLVGDESDVGMDACHPVALLFWLAKIRVRFCDCSSNYSNPNPGPLLDLSVHCASQFISSMNVGNGQADWPKTYLFDTEEM